MDVKFIDNSKEVLEEFYKKVGLSLSAIGGEAEGYAKEDCPVDTGRLMNSITHEVDETEKAVYVGTDVEYATAVEYNDTAYHENGKAHFLRDAVATHSEEYDSLVKKILIDS